MVCYTLISRIDSGISRLSPASTVCDAFLPRVGTKWGTPDYQRSLTFAHRAPATPKVQSDLPVPFGVFQPNASTKDLFRTSQSVALYRRKNARSPTVRGLARQRLFRGNTPISSKTLHARRKNRRLALFSAEYLPVFQFALRDRANPSGVLGPVLGPPCILQRPLSHCRSTAGTIAPGFRPASFHFRQIPPPELPFLSNPRRSSRGSLKDLATMLSSYTCSQLGSSAIGPATAAIFL
jgi:hypothetical protein